MDREDLKAYCQSKKATTAEFPFGPDALVMKVMGKMFALIPWGDPQDTPNISLKCDPVLAEILRQTYPDHVKPAYHMNKMVWKAR